MRCGCERRLAGVALLALLASASSCSDDDAQQERQSGLSCSVTYESFAGPLLLDWCVGCHHSALPAGERQGAPPGIDFDTLDGIRAHAPRIRARAVELDTMPPVGGPSAAERQLLGEWIDCGMPAATDGFEPPPPSGGSMPDPEPTGTCAEPRQPLADELLPRCRAATLECVTACSSSGDDGAVEACRNGCLAADGTPPAMLGALPVDCAACSLLQLLACADTSGCHAETASFLCCMESCGGGDACSSGACAGELQAFGLCIYYSAPSCLEFSSGPIADCFDAAAPGNAGAGGL